ncbi:MAG: hypothetical protein WDO17_16310 [Alphaproteobacteria bacterium]
MTAVRRTQLARLGAWISLATLAVIVVTFVARTESGLRRIATLLAPAEAARTSKAPQLANRPPDQEVEQRRLAEAVRNLTADRDRLAARLTVLERNLDEVTGSIPPAAAKAAPVPVPSVAASPLPPPAAPPAQASQTAPAGQARIAAGHLATGTNPADSVATKTEFGVDIGGNTSIEGLRSLWSTLKSGQPALFDGLRPVIAVREGQKPGAIELRLIAGPLPNASIAARLCAALAAANQPCQPAVFDGQRLALQ